MSKVRWMAVMGILVLALAMLFPIVAGAAPPADAAKGKEVWDAELCKNCHGPQGEGRLAAPLAGTQRTHEEVIAQVRRPRQNMPAFNERQISDTEIRDAVDYLKTLQRPASFTPVRYEAKADDPAGKVLFNNKRCVACHGEAFAQTAAGIVASGRRTLSLEDVTKQLRTPRANMPAFSEAQVTAAEAQQIHAWLAPIVERAAQAPASAGAAATPSAMPTTGAPGGMLLGLLVGLAGLGVAGLGMALRRIRR